MIASQAVLIAIAIDWDGRRQVLAVELANRESRSSWRDLLLGLKARGLHGVEFVVADAIMPACGQRCGKFWRRRPTSDALCIFCATRLTTCRAGSRMTVCRSCVGCRLARQRVIEIFETQRLGRRQYRRDTDLLPVAAPAP